MSAIASIPISAIVLTKNESAGIAVTLSHLRAFDEVIVVDSSSTDGTDAIAEQFGARVVNFVWNGSYPKKKQWSLESAGATHDWVLLLDADEYPDDALTDEIARLFEGAPPSDIGAYDIALSYRFAGRFLRFGHRVTKRSLLNRRATSFPPVDDLGAPGIREVEGHYQPQTALNVARVRGRIRHDDKDPVASWFDRHNRYSDWESHLNHHRQAKRDIASKRTWKGRLFDTLPLKPILFFSYGYLFRLGFLDGRAGLDYHVALAMYYWQIGVKTRELSRLRDLQQRAPGND